MRHPFFWGVIIGAGGLWLYQHWMPLPKANMGKYTKG